MTEVEGLGTQLTSPGALLALGVATVDDEDVPGLDLGAFLCACPDLELLGCLGRGGMGIVYRARQVRLDRHVAVKLMSPELSSDPEFAARFEREARALARLDHPGIVRVHEFGEAAGVYYLIMELVDGPSLRDLMGRDLDAPAATDIVGQICDALAYAHEQGVVHRDIKPENVLVSARGTIKIADFGLAKLHHSVPRASATKTRRILGTPQYMAPEQITDPESVDQRSDIFAIGVVFYEMLTGQLPVGRFRAPSELGRGDSHLDEVVLRALESDRERRYQTARELGDELRSQAVDHPERTQVDVASGPPARPWIGWAAAGLLLFAGAGGAYALWGGSPEPAPDPVPRVESPASPDGPEEAPAEPSPVVDAAALNRWPAKEIAWLAPDLSTVVGLDWAELRQAPLVKRITAEAITDESKFGDCGKALLSRTHKVLVAFDDELDVAEILAYGEWSPADLLSCGAALKAEAGTDGEDAANPLDALGVEDPEKTAIAERDGLVLISLRSDDTAALQARLDAAPSNTALRDRVLRSVDAERPLWLVGQGEGLPFEVRSAAGEFQVWDSLNVGLRLDFDTEDEAKEARIVLNSYVGLMKTMAEAEDAPEFEVVQKGKRVEVSGDIDVAGGSVSTHAGFNVAEGEFGMGFGLSLSGDEPARTNDH